uniref:Uncharacterized mitochondrial protein AtMg00810-like n=1 Tax=Tanacetum cinerariifolium TaxID=118510 RepID=A0A699H8W3_TANCI|nr:uncharacterized mitochondrial protein AtMg00810-like [Tanacetum cinerariifolium]
MISIRIKKFHKRIGRKLQFDTRDTVGFDKTKVECFNCHKIWHFARDCRAKWNQDSRRRDGRNYMPSGPDVEIDYSKFTYGLKQTSADESDSKPVDFASSDSDSSVETTTSMPAPLDNAPKLVCEPKVCIDVPIIAEYESNSDDDSVSLVQENIEKPSVSFTDSVKHVKSPRKIVKEIGTPNNYLKIKKQDKHSHTRKGLGYARKSCFVSGSFSHLIRDCEFHEKRMAKQVALTKSEEKDTGQQAHRPVWNNVKRANHQNKFVPSVLLTKTSKIPINAARQKFSRQATLTSTASKVNTARPFVNETRPKRCFYKSLSPHKRHFHNKTTQINTFANNKVNTINTSLCAVKGNWDTAVKASACCNWRNKRNTWNKVFKYNSGSKIRISDDPHKALKDKGIVDSGCSKHTTRNKAHLVDYQEFKGSSVAFGGSNGKITGKGKIKAGRVLVTKPQNKTPYELLTGRQPIISYLRPFGCHVTILNTIDQLGKFDGKSDSGFLVRYSLNSKAFKVYNLETKRVEENLHVNFVENKPNVAGKGHAWMFDCDYLTNFMNYVLVSLENQANKSAGLQEANNSAGTRATDDQGATSEEIDLHDEHFVLPIWPAYSTTVKSSEDKIQKTTDCKPIRKEATHETQDVNTNNTNLLNAVSTPVSAVGLSRALNDDEPSYPHDPSMPCLEDIYVSPSVRIFTDSSYDDEAVQTRSKVHKNFEARALISQALEGESWVDAMQEELLQFQIQKVWFLVDLAFGKKAIGTKWVYRNKKDENGVVVRNKARLVAQGHRQEEGINYDEVFTHKEDGIFISQDKYVAEILKKFDFLNVKTASTPIETQKPLVKDEEAADVDVHLYRSMIGSLMYLSASRPDIMFAVCACSTFQVTPKTSHLQAVKRIFRYLKGQPKLGLWYPKVSSFNLEAYSDSDYSGANLDRKSTTGGCQFLGRRLISWQCKKQTIVATSTTYAEYVAAAYCCG